VSVQIFDAVNDLNTNPQGFALVVLVLVTTFVLFMASKRLAGTRRYEMLARGHTAGAEIRATPLQAAGLWALGLGVAGLALLPHFAVILQSVAGRWFLTVWPASFQVDSYTGVLKGGLAGRSIVNSLFYAGASVVVDVGLGVFLAWLLTRRKLPFAGVIDGLTMLPLAIPGLVLAFGLFAGFDIDEKRHPWLDSVLDPRTNPTLLLVASYAIRRLPYMVRSAVAGFQQTSVALEEASGCFGARPWTTLRRITIPLIGANLVAGAILTFSFAMLEVSDSLILASREQHYPIAKSIWALLARIDPSAPSLACALGVVGMAILGGSLFVAGRILGQRLGSLFRA
jgi:iron(III) transport system permease protein